MITKLCKEDFQDIYTVINKAAIIYKGAIPEDMYHEPYMNTAKLQAEIDSGIEFFGIHENGSLVAVMGIQKVQDVTLIRHAYVQSSLQRKGHGQKLLKYLTGLAQTQTILVGTWTAAVWAVKFYEKNNFQLVSKEEKERLLHKYWNISERQIRTSVVFKLKEGTN
jgi:N-acetylglutamate synthase-like GNAT family acetyltransferase